MQTPTRRAALTLTFTLAAALPSGCAAWRTIPAGEPPVAVAIKFKNVGVALACPYAVEVNGDMRCRDVAPDKKLQCLEVSQVRKGTVTIRFQAVHDTEAPGTVDLDFSLDFDPFSKGRNAFKGKNGKVLDLVLHPDTPPKTYTYNVFSDGCPVLDPQIVIRPPVSG